MSATQQTLAQMIRSKHPGAYDDMDDVTLEKNVLAKYPEYGDLPKTKMTSSTGQQAEDWWKTPTPDIRGGKWTPPGETRPESSSSPQQRLKNTEAVAATMGTGFIGAGLATAPIATLLGVGGGVAGGVVGSHVGKKVGEKVGAPELGEDIGAAVGSVAGGLGGGKTSELLPNAAKAGASLGNVKIAAGDVPIDMAKPGNTALELWTQSERGANLPAAVRKFVQRATKPGSEPITYEEAKDFQSNVSALSANEKMNLKPNTARLLGQLNADLKESLETAADTKGKGEQFTQAMKEYHNAMRLSNLTDEVKAALWKAALAGAGIYGVKKFWDASQ